eukprot:scaffold26940_cov117-Phaeocystis_antarctica.AAC.15
MPLKTQRYEWPWARPEPASTTTVWPERGPFSGRMNETAGVGKYAKRSPERANCWPLELSSTTTSLRSTSAPSCNRTRASLCVRVSIDVHGVKEAALVVRHADSTAGALHLDGRPLERTQQVDSAKLLQQLAAVNQLNHLLHGALALAPLHAVHVVLVDVVLVERGEAYAQPTADAGAPKGRGRQLAVAHTKAFTTCAVAHEGVEGEAEVVGGQPSRAQPERACLVVVFGSERDLARP